MTAISVRDLDDRVAARLKVQAARNGRSMEAEVRAILTDAVAPQTGEGLNLAQTIGRRFSAIGGTADAQIAAICATHDATLATRNTRDFEGTGIDLINPWDG